MYKKSITHYITKTIIDILLVLSIICVVALPFVAERIFQWIDYGNGNYFHAFTAIVFFSGICCSYILYNLHRMFKSLLVGNPFVDKNISHLRKMSVSCALIALVYLIKCLFMFTFATVVIAAVFIIGCLMCLTLKDLFKQAINYKNENDLTI